MLLTRFFRVFLPKNAVLVWGVALLMTATGAIAQSQQPSGMSRQMMYEDFDTLVATLRRASPHIAVKKDLWGYDAFREIGRLRQQIDTISSDDAFVLLINRALTATQDQHTSLMQELPASYQDKAAVCNLYLPLAYIDGHYFLTRSFVQGPDTLRAGAEIVRIENLRPDDYCRRHLCDMYCRYDARRKIFYNTDLTSSSEVVQSGKIALRFASRPKRTLTLDTRQELRFLYPSQDTLRGVTVQFWQASGTLYIKCLRMDTKFIPVLQRKIAAHRSTPLQRIILDFRNNSGGNDVVWQAIYAAILPKSYRYPLQIDGYYPSFAPPEYLGDHELFLSELHPDTSALLAKYGFYRYTDETQQIIPTDSSLAFRGPVYVIGDDIYSSAGSAFVVANADPTDNIHSIGRKSDLFLGVGYSPVVFQLPHSGISYRIAPSIEVTRAKTLGDLLHDRYETEIPLTLEEVLTRANYRGNTYGAHFLQNFDPLIRAALNDLRQ